MKISEWFGQEVENAIANSNTDRDLTPAELNNLEEYPRTGEGQPDLYIGIGAWILAQLKKLLD